MTFMRMWVNANHTLFVSSGTCPKCGFHGDPNQIEELSRLEWLLRETGLAKGYVKTGFLLEYHARLILLRNRMADYRGRSL